MLDRLKSMIVDGKKRVVTRKKLLLAKWSDFDQLSYGENITVPNDVVLISRKVCAFPPGQTYDKA